MENAKIPKIFDSNAGFRDFGSKVAFSVNLGDVGAENSPPPKIGNATIENIDVISSP